MITRRRAGLAATAVATLALTAACGSSGNQSAGTPTTDNVQPAGQGTSDYGYGSSGGGGQAGGDTANTGGKALQAAPSAGTLALHQDAKLGPVVTDSKGMTLYRFDKDTPDPSKSNCSGSCATTWPVVPADGASAPAGIDKSKLGSVTRADGTKQLTIGGWPAYRFAKDTKPGDTKGQGVGGTWNALASDGKKAGAQKPGDVSVFDHPSSARSSSTARAAPSTASTRTAPGR